MQLAEQTTIDLATNANHTTTFEDAKCLDVLEFFVKVNAQAGITTSLFFFFAGVMGGMCSPLGKGVLTQYGTTAPLGLLTFLCRHQGMASLG